MAKAAIALVLSKDYRQDEALDWGYLTQAEESHRLRMSKAARPPREADAVEADAIEANAIDAGAIFSHRRTLRSRCRIHSIPRTVPPRISSLPASVLTTDTTTAAQRRRPLPPQPCPAPLTVRSAAASNRIDTFPICHPPLRNRKLARFGSFLPANTRTLIFLRPGA